MGVVIQSLPSKLSNSLDFDIVTDNGIVLNLAYIFCRILPKSLVLKMKCHGYNVIANGVRAVDACWSTDARHRGDVDNLGVINNMQNHLGG